MITTTTKLSSVQNVGSPAPTSPINVTFTGDSIAIVGFAVWALFSKVLAPKTIMKLDTFMNHLQREKEINTCLAQIGILTNASRVVLCAFHNGQVDFTGYHLQKMSTINSYVARDCSAMAAPIKEVQISSFIQEIEVMLKKDDWVTSRYQENLPQSCKDFFSRNGIQCLYNRLVKVGNLPIGIISVQYGIEERDKFDITIQENRETLNSLYNEVSEIMRQRFVKPSLFRKLMKLWSK